MPRGRPKQPFADELVSNNILFRLKSTGIQAELDYSFYSKEKYYRRLVRKSDGRIALYIARIQ